MRHQCPECGIFFAGPPSQKYCRRCPPARSHLPKYKPEPLRQPEAPQVHCVFDLTIVLQAMKQHTTQRISAEAAEDLRLWLLQDVT